MVVAAATMGAALRKLTAAVELRLAGLKSSMAGQSSDGGDFFLTAAWAAVVRNLGSQWLGEFDGCREMRVTVLGVHN
jgi:hypothetical protein